MCYSAEFGGFCLKFGIVSRIMIFYTPKECDRKYIITYTRDSRENWKDTSRSGLVWAKQRDFVGFLEQLGSRTGEKFSEGSRFKFPAKR